MLERDTREAQNEVPQNETLNPVHLQTLTAEQLQRQQEQQQQRQQQVELQRQQRLEQQQQERQQRQLRRQAQPPVRPAQQRLAQQEQQLRARRIPMRPVPQQPFQPQPQQTPVWQQAYPQTAPEPPQSRLLFGIPVAASPTYQAQVHPNAGNNHQAGLQQGQAHATGQVGYNNGVIVNLPQLGHLFQAFIQAYLARNVHASHAAASYNNFSHGQNQIHNHTVPAQAPQTQASHGHAQADAGNVSGQNSLPANASTHQRTQTQHSGQHGGSQNGNGQQNSNPLWGIAAANFNNNNRQLQGMRLGQTSPLNDNGNNIIDPRLLNPAATSTNLAHHGYRVPVNTTDRQNDNYMAMSPASTNTAVHGDVGTGNRRNQVQPEPVGLTGEQPRYSDPFLGAPPPNFPSLGFDWEGQGQPANSAANPPYPELPGEPTQESHVDFSESMLDHADPAAGQQQNANTIVNFEEFLLEDIIRDPDRSADT